MKFRYRVYGLNIESDIILDELIELDNNKENNMDATISLGEVSSEIKNRMKQTGYRCISKNNICIYVKDIAIYQIKDGNSIVVEPLKEKDINRIKSYLLGWCFGALFLQKNIIALHGATMVKDNKAFVIAGESGSGKSTLSSALIKKGYDFISDDVSVVDSCKNEFIIHPAYPQQKLGKDAMIELGYDINKYEINKKSDIRQRYKVKMCNRFIDKALPIQAIFEIVVGNNDKVEIERIEGSDKLDCILNNVYLINVEENSGMRPNYFKQCLELAKSIPIYKIKRPKGQFTLEDQINSIEDILICTD